MTFAQEVQQRIFSGLDLRRQEVSAGDAFARVFTNLQVVRIGNIAKRKGYARALQRNFGGPVRGIIPTFYCFFLKQILIYVDDPSGPTSQIRTGGLVTDCRQVPAAQGFTATPLTDPNRIELSWILPPFEWIAGVRILRSEEGQPAGPEDPNSTLLLEGPAFDPNTGQPSQSFTDIAVQANVLFFYAIFLFALC